MINLSPIIKTVVHKPFQNNNPKRMNRHSSEHITPANPFALLSGGNINLDRLQAAGRLSLDMVNLIEAEIEQKKFQVNEVQKDFKLKLKTPFRDSTSRGDYPQSKMPLHEDEPNGPDLSPTKIGGLTHSHSEKKYFKSEMTQEDIDKIKRIKMMQKKFEMELENKARLYEQNLNKFHDEEKELLERQKKEKNEERLREVANKIAQIRQRQSERARKMEEEKLKLTELKREKKLYERLDQQYRTVELEEERKKEEIKIALKRQKNINFQDIKEHERKYEQIMKGQREDREKKLGNLPRGASKKYYQSRALKDLIEEEIRVKAEHLDKKQEVYERYTKERQYAEHVRNKYLPSAPPKEEDKDKNTTPPSVSAAEMHRIGNDYMKQVHGGLSNLKGSSITKQERKEDVFKYKDYLKEMRGERKLSSHKESRYLEQIDNLMKRENMTQEQKFYKAKILAQQLEEGKGRNSQKLISSINAKLHLLKSIEPQLQQ